MNRVKCSCIAKRRTVSEVINVLKFNQHLVSVWENPHTRIDVDDAKQIAIFLNVPVDFICGKEFRVTRPMSDWCQDEKNDYYRMPPEGREYLLFEFGRGVFTKAEAPETPIIEDIKIAIVDGRDDDSEMLHVVLTYPESKEDETNQNDDNPKT